MKRHFFISGILMSLSLLLNAQNYEYCELGYCSKCHKKFTRKAFFQPFGHQSMEGKEVIANMAQFEGTDSYDPSCNQQVKSEKAQEKSFNAQKEKSKNGEEILEWHSNGKAAITKAGSIKKFYNEDGSLLYSYDFNTEDAKFYKAGKLVAYGKGKPQENSFKIEKEEDLVVKYGTWVENGQMIEYATGIKISYQQGKLGNNTYKGYLTANGEKNGSYEEFYPNGKLFIKGTYLNDKKNGNYEEYYENGKLRVKGSYKNDTEDGPFEFYHENGRLHQKATLKNGKLEGLVEEHYDNGQMKSKMSYVNGKAEGSSTSYYQNGQVMFREYYTQGKLNQKDWVKYSQSGDTLGKGSWDNGVFTGFSERMMDSENKESLYKYSANALQVFVDGGMLKYNH